MRKSRPSILVTNDDGITAPGIKMLVSIARELGDVTVVAPDSPQSGMGHALTLTEPLRLSPSDVFDGVTSYECSGTPVDCVKLAKHVVAGDQGFDLCLSGINHGSNASINILYSGTVSAAMEASLEGIDSLGFSLLDYSHSADFSQAKDLIRGIIVQVLRDGLQDCKLLNINIPKLQKEDIKGVKVCRQAAGSWVEKFTEALDPRGLPYYWLTGEFVHQEHAEDTDLHALDQGYISVVPSGHDLTRYPALSSMKYLEL